VEGCRLRGWVWLAAPEASGALLTSTSQGTWQLLPARPAGQVLPLLSCCGCCTCHCRPLALQGLSSQLPSGQRVGAEQVAPALLGHRCWVKWPYLQEAVVEAVSDAGGGRAGAFDAMLPCLS